MVVAQLTRGQVHPVGASDIAVSVRHTAPVDMSAFLLTADGLVRVSTDLVFYNQPAGAGVQLVPGAPGQPSSLAIALRTVPPGIEHVRVVVALEDQHAQLGDYPAPEVRITDSRGTTLFEYVIEGLGPESAVLALDLDRTGAGWQVRALGHGYRGGLAALAAGHGVGGNGQNSGGAEKPPEGEGGPLSGALATELVAGQDVALRTARGEELTLVKLGLGWDPVLVEDERGLHEAEIDLDASALLYAGPDLVDAAYFGRLSSRDGAVRHQGDDVSGEGKGDNEIILIDLTRIPVHVTAVVFAVTSYAGHTFANVRNPFWRLVDSTTDRELVHSTLHGGGAHTGMVLAKVHRGDDEVWHLRAIDEPIQAGHPVEAVSQLIPFL